jgi:glycogen synthase
MHSLVVLQELGLPEDANVPVLAFIGRLDEQKGVDLIRESFDWLMSEGVQLILLGSGREDLENSLRCAEMLALHHSLHVAGLHLLSKWQLDHDIKICHQLV